MNNLVKGYRKVVSERRAKGLPSPATGTTWVIKKRGVGNTTAYRPQDNIDLSTLKPGTKVKLVGAIDKEHYLAKPDGGKPFGITIYALESLVDRGEWVQVRDASTQRTAAHHQDGKTWYVDTAFMNATRGFPGCEMKHLGFGEFYMDCGSKGKVEFDRMRGKDFPGQSGRSHQMYDDKNGKLVEELVKWMEKKNKSERVASTQRRAAFKPDFKSGKELARFLRGTLIPDLKDSGKRETAKDFAELLPMLSGRKDPDMGLLKWLETTLIPDLHDSGTHDTAHNFEEAIYWLTGKAPKTGSARRVRRVVGAGMPVWRGPRRMTEESVLEVVKWGPTTAWEVAGNFEVSTERATKLLKEMVKKGLLKATTKRQVSYTAANTKTAAGSPCEGVDCYGIGSMKHVPVSEHQAELAGFNVTLEGRGCGDLSARMAKGVQAASDWCKATPACKGNLGLSRSVMPQLRDEIVPKFVNSLKKLGVKVKKAMTPVKQLKATQKEINADKVNGIAKAVKDGKLVIDKDPVMTSKEDYILDGHHRWAAMLTTNPNWKIPTLKFSLPIKPLLNAANKFEGVGSESFQPAKAMVGRTSAQWASLEAEMKKLTGAKLGPRKHKLLTSQDKKNLPKLYGTEDVPADEKMVWVKFFNAYGSGTWLAMEFDGKDTFFGYVMGLQSDELGYFSLSELDSLEATINGKKLPGLPAIERDKYFKPVPLGQAKRRER